MSPDRHSPMHHGPLTRRSLLAAAGAAALLTRVPLAGGAVPVPAYPGTARFRILRSGKPIGTHVITTAPDGETGGHRVTTEIRIAVKVLGFTAYRYTHRAEEVWADGRLVRLDTRTARSGEKTKRVTAVREGDALHVSGSGGEHTLHGDVLTTSLWHSGTPDQERLLGIEDGTVKTVRGRFAGDATIDGPDGPLPARRYAVRGDFTRDLWYDDRGRLLRAAFNADRDGSRIVLKLERHYGDESSTTTSWAFSSATFALR